MTKEELLRKVNRSIIAIWFTLIFSLLFLGASIATILMMTPLIWFYLSFGTFLAFSGGIFFQLFKINGYYNQYLNRKKEDVSGHLL